MWVTRQRVERGRVAGACNRKILSAGTGVLHSSRSGVAVKTSSSVPPTLRFGVFELDPQAGELRKKGMKIRLQGQPLEILAMLLQHPGETITRQELQKKLWPADTFVDFEQGLNNAMKRLRASLDDSAENPHFIETLPRHGYRFIGSVNGLEQVPAERAKNNPQRRSFNPACRSWDRGRSRIGGGAGGTECTRLARPSLHAISKTADSSHRCVAVDQSVWRPGTGILRRWYDRKFDHGIGKDQQPARDLAPVSHAVQGQQEVATRDRRGTEGGCRHGGYGRTLRGPDACDDTPVSSLPRAPAVGPRIRSQHSRCSESARRDCTRHHR